jgi:hypothetical protein
MFRYNCLFWIDFRKGSERVGFWKNERLLLKISYFSDVKKAEKYFVNKSNSTTLSNLVEYWVELNSLELDHLWLRLLGSISPTFYEQLLHTKIPKA